MSPKSVQVIAGGKSFFLPDKLAAKLFDAVSRPAEMMVGELKSFHGPLT